MPTLENPGWLVAVLPLAAAYLVWRPRSRALRILWILTLGALLAGLCGPTLRLRRRGGLVVVVADRSASLPSGSYADQSAWIELLHSSRKRSDRLAVVAFGAEAAVEAQPGGGFEGFVHEVDANQSNLTAGLERALALVPPGVPARVLVFSDGQWTGRPPLDVAGVAAGRGVGIDFRSQLPSPAPDVYIDRVTAPASVRPGQAFLVAGWVHCPAATTVRYRLRRGDTVLARDAQTLPGGMTRLLFRDVAPASGTLEFNLDVEPEPGPDPEPRNNHCRFLVNVDGARPLLLLSPAPESGLGRLFQQARIDLASASEERPVLDLTALSNYSGIVLENVPASDLGMEGMENTAAWITELGAGLLVTGGENAYGPGGYFKSPLDPLLPVSMELRQEHRKLRLAIVVALDRSGSMSAGVGLGRTKMDLANLGTAQVLDLLSERDELGVIAVDSTPHEIVDLDAVARVRAQRSKILSIESMGGGIFVYEALVAASRMLMRADAQTRHVILFADAADAEQPGDYKDLIKTCRQAGITVSVVGLGTEKDPDAALLRDIAERGEGRCFFTNRPTDIPRLFAQDTFAVARSTFISDETPVAFQGGLIGLLGEGLPPPPNVGGYNLCYIRPEATQAARTKDEYAAPLIAYWQAGNGRAACYTGEADGEFAGPIAGWERAGDVFAGMARWVSGAANELPEGMLATQDVQDGTCRVRLHFDAERDPPPMDARPMVTFLRGVPGAPPATVNVPMQWEDASTLTAQLLLSGSETVLASLSIGPDTRTILAPVCLPYSPEFRPPDPAKGEAVLRDLAGATGGRECVSLAETWGRIPRLPRRVALSPWCFSAAALLLLVSVLQRRSGILSLRRRAAPEAPGQAVSPEPKTGRTGRRRRTRRGRKTSASPSRVASAAAGEEADSESDAEAQTPASGAPADDLADAMREARRRANRRTRGK